MTLNCLLLRCSCISFFIMLHFITCLCWVGRDRKWSQNNESINTFQKSPCPHQWNWRNIPYFYLTNKFSKRTHLVIDCLNDGRHVHTKPKSGVKWMQYCRLMQASRDTLNSAIAWLFDDSSLDYSYCKCWSSKGLATIVEIRVSLLQMASRNNKTPAWRRAPKRIRHSSLFSDPFTHKLNHSHK